MEFPHLKKLDAKWRKKGVQVISIPLERDRAAAGQWKKEFKVGFPILFDPKMNIARAYGVEAIPLNVAIDKNGKVVKVIEGANVAALDAAVKQIATKK